MSSGPARGGALAAGEPRGGLSLTSLGRSLGTLYVTGGVVALVWLSLPHGDASEDRVLLAIALAAIALGGLLAATAKRLVALALHAGLGVIQVVVGVACVVTQRPDTDLRLFLLWAAPYAALAFGRRAAIAHLLWTAIVACCAVALLPGPPTPETAGSLLLLLSTLISGGVVVAVAARSLRRSEAEQRRQALHDPLTGLRNRRGLLEVLDVRHGPAAEHGGALLLLDLDGFKGVNDRFGHDRGDAVLVDVARRLVGTMRPGDVVCRLGGDEFAVVAPDLPEQDVRAFSQRVADACALVVTGRQVDGATSGRPVTVRASAGVRVLSPGPVQATTLLREADVALYTSKRAGRAQAEVWREGMRRDGEEHHELSEDLRAALREDQLRLVYQPVVDAGTLQVKGVEALARWRHPVRGDVPPDVFVRCAERWGLAGELTRWVLRTACDEAVGWARQLDGTTVKLAVNISALQLGDLQVVHDVRTAIEASGLAASALVLEVTETAEVVHLDRAKAALTALAQLGVGLALDDFGTGHSSLTHAQALPFHILKVDRSFVAAAAEGDRRAIATIAAIGALAGRLDVDVVAEGVEDPGQLPALRQLGCGFAQGFALSRPVEPAVVRAALTPPRPGGWLLGVAEPVLAQR